MIPGAEHHTVDVGGTRIHYLTAGSGRPVLLLHGWPQTSYAWRRVVPQLQDCRVVLPDLRGFGLSAKPESGYDAATMAADLHGLLSCLQLDDVVAVGHDWGATFAYALAATFPGDVAALGILEMLLPGFGMLEEAMSPRPDGAFLWQVGFHSVPDVPEMLLRGKERPYLRWFFENHSYDPTAVGAADVDVYVEALTSAGGLRSSLALYRAYFETTAQIASLAERPLELPVCAYGGESSLGETVLRSARAVAPAAFGGVVPRCGHWILEERPEVAASAVRDLLALV